MCHRPAPCSAEGIVSRSMALCVATAATRPGRRRPFAAPRSRPSTRRAGPGPRPRPRGTRTPRGRRGPRHQVPVAAGPGRSRRTSCRRRPPPPGTSGRARLSRSRARTGRAPPLPESRTLEEAVERVDDRVPPVAANRRSRGGTSTTYATSRPSASERKDPERTSAEAGRARSPRGWPRGRRAGSHRGHLTRRARCALHLREHRVERAGGEPPGERVLLRDVEGAEEAQAAPRSWTAPWPKARPRGAVRPVSRSIARKPSIAMRPSTRTARTPGSSAHSRDEVLAAARELLRRRFVRGGRAAADRRDVAVAQGEPVVAGRPTPAGSRSPPGAGPRTGSPRSGRR
jgi:hypothetical protein